MNFQTKIKLQPNQHNQIAYNSKVLLLGSCFSENIGNKFSYFKFENFQNPFGILFHPLAIETLITNGINKTQYAKESLVFNNEQWHCFDAHSKLSHQNPDELLKQLNSEISKTNTFLKDATHIIITLGTAWTYRCIETDKRVANCHKIPQKKFLKELLSVDEITESLDAIVSLVKSINPDVNFVFTVSPVRHIKDGFVENTQSKAHLVTAIHRFLSGRAIPKFRERSLNYFPSYEIMLDELRDYRFYKEDMLHPSTLAIDYIWEKFKQVWISEESHQIMEDVEVIQKGMAHKPFNSNSEAHQKFLLDLEEKKVNLNAKFNNIRF